MNVAVFCLLQALGYGAGPQPFGANIYAPPMQQYQQGMFTQTTHLRTLLKACRSD